MKTQFTWNSIKIVRFNQLSIFIIYKNENIYISYRYNLPIPLPLISRIPSSLQWCLMVKFQIRILSFHSLYLSLFFLNLSFSVYFREKIVRDTERNKRKKIKKISLCNYSLTCVFKRQLNWHSWNST